MKHDVVMPVPRPVALSLGAPSQKRKHVKHTVVPELLDDTFAHPDWFLANRIAPPVHPDKNTRDIMRDCIRWAIIAGLVAWIGIIALIAFALRIYAFLP